MRRMFMWGAVASGLIAAYMMHRRGESVFRIARTTIFNPFDALKSEIKMLPGSMKKPVSSAA